MFTDTKTPAKDEAEIASTANAKTRWRTKRVICIILLIYLARKNRAYWGTHLPNIEGTILWLRDTAGYINASCRNLLLTKCVLILQWVAPNIGHHVP